MAVDFNGTTQALYSLSYSPPSTGVVTVGARVYPDAAGNFTTIMKNWGASTRGQFHLGLESTNGDVSVYFTQSDNTQKGPVREGSGSPLSTGAWHTVVCVADGSNLRIYRDGVERGTPIAYNGTLKSSFPGIGIGAKLNNVPDNIDTSVPGYLDGRIAECFVASVAWSGAEIAAFEQGYSPILIRRGVRNFWPILNAQTAALDMVGGVTLTLANSPASIGHPRIIMPPRLRPATLIAAAVASGNPWHYYAQQ